MSKIAHIEGGSEMNFLHWNQKNISAKIMQPLFLLMLIMVLLIIFSVQFLVGNYFERYIKENAQKNGIIIANEIENKKLRALSSLDWFENSSRFVNAFQTGNRAQAVALGQTAMEAFGLEYLVITDTAGNIFIRAHDPDNFGDSIANQVNIQNALKGEKNVQVENGKVVKFSIRAGTPLKDGAGQIIGALSTGYVLGSAETAASFGTMMNKEVVIFDGSKGIASTIQPDDVEFASTIQLTENVMKKTLGEGQQYFGELKIGKENYIGIYVPFQDVSGSYTGVIFSGEPKSVIQTLSNAISVLISVVVAVIAMIIFFLLLFVIRSIVKPLKHLTDVSKRVAEGDLTMTLNYQSKDEIGQLVESFQRVLTAFNDAIGNIRDSSEQVKDGARNVADGSQSLSQGSTSQASVIDELSASISDMASQIKTNAINANQASDLTNSAKTYAEKGNNHMNEMLVSMNEINEASTNISKIIKVIDDIAFQTNILALNAAVEAATAGQHGKGFAVVAEEVRSLAARSAQAAQETTDLIEGSKRTVMNGAKIANETSEALNGIVEKIGESAGLIEGIADASSVQATGIAEINKGIEQVALVIQNNSATAEESAAASEQLSAQAVLLAKTVEMFRIKT